MYSLQSKSFVLERNVRKRLPKQKRLRLETQALQPSRDPNPGVAGSGPAIHGASGGNRTRTTEVERF